MQRFIVLVAATLILLSLQSCVFTVLDWATPTSGYTLQKNIAYGEHIRQRLDIYSPESIKPKKTIVFFYGGAWDSGNKENYRFVAQAFASEGYRVVIPDYRLYPEIKFPTFLEDAGAAVKWVSEATQEPIVLMGHSAGAHIAAMLILNEKFLENTGVDQNRLQSWVGLSGPYDFLPFTSRTVKDIFSTAAKPEFSQPIYFADKKSIPALLIHGKDDKRVLPKNSINLAKALRDNNTEVKEIYYEGVGHAATVSGISVRLRHQSDAFSDILEYLSEI